MIKEKFLAALSHLIISSIVIFGLLFIIYKVWYPNGYADLSGLAEILLLVVTIDLIIGPILTFVIFKKGKKTLKFDLAVIAALQIAAFSYGGFAIYKGHPSYVVYAGNRFELVATKDISPKDATLDEFQVSTFGFPKLAYAKMPSDITLRNKILFDNDLEKHPELYKPLNDYLATIIERSFDPERVFKEPHKQVLLEEFLVNKSASKDTLIFVPIVGSSKDATLALNKNTGEVAGIIDVIPWEN